MKRIKQMERTVLYEVVKDMYVELCNKIPINIGLMFILLTAILAALGLYLTSIVCFVNPITLYHWYNTFKRV